MPLNVTSNTTEPFEEIVDKQLKNVEIITIFINLDKNSLVVEYKKSYDDGSGGTATYLTIDGGDENIQFSKNGKFLDNVKALFGNSNDRQIYHDGSNAYINESGTGDLVILSEVVSINNAANTENIANIRMLFMIYPPFIDIYYNNIIMVIVHHPKGLYFCIS